MINIPFHNDPKGWFLSLNLLKDFFFPPSFGGSALLIYTFDPFTRNIIYAFIPSLPGLKTTWKPGKKTRLNRWLTQKNRVKDAPSHFCNHLPPFCWKSLTWCLNSKTFFFPQKQVVKRKIQSVRERERERETFINTWKKLWLAVLQRKSNHRLLTFILKDEAPLESSW